MHNGGWRILTWQISDFMQKKISDVQRRILNTSPGIVVFRATWCSTKNSSSPVERKQKNLSALRPGSSERLRPPDSRSRAQASAYRLQDDRSVTSGRGCGDHAVEIQQTGRPRQPRDERRKVSVRRRLASANVSQFSMMTS